MIELRRLLALYPRSWRGRYEAEMVEVLADRAATWSDAIDLIRGALDAHLHPARPSRIPAVAAVTAGAAWTVVAVASVREPVPADWPGFLAWSLPVASIGAAAGLVALAGVVLGVGPGPSRIARLATGAGLLGVVALVAALIVASLGGPYGALSGAALSLAGAGTTVVGAIVVGRGSTVTGGLLLVSGVAWLLPAPVAWLMAAAGWSALGLWLVAERGTRSWSDRQRPT